MKYFTSKYGVDLEEFMGNVKNKIDEGVQNNKMYNFDIREISLEFNKLLEAAEFIRSKNETIPSRGKVLNTTNPENKLQRSKT